MKKINKITIKRQYDENPDLSYLGTFSDEPGKYAIGTSGNSDVFQWFNADNVGNMKQARQNFKRMMEFETGDVHCIGIRAEAEIVTGQENFGTLNWIKSGGLWGIDSDAGEDVMKEVEGDQLMELMDILIELGFTAKEIETAPREVETE